MAKSNSSRIRHSVIFKLKYAKGSAEERDFFNAAKKLAAIPGVEKFECLKQVSEKNKFEFGISMEFASQQLYVQYSNHPEHTAFVQQRWLKEVEDFMEIDFEVIG
jgi:heme-degrading monooxygenase HmoA